MERVAAVARHLHPEPAAHEAIYPGYQCDPTKAMVRWKGNGGAFKATTIPKRFSEKAELFAETPLIHTKREKTDTEWTSWTWSGYYAEARAVAKALIGLGLQAHDATNILAANCPEWFFAAQGSILMGGMAAGIYITNSPPAVEYIVDHSKAKVLFVDNQDQLEKALAIRTNCHSLEKVVILPFGDAHPPPADCPLEGEGLRVVPGERPPADCPLEGEGSRVTAGDRTTALSFVLSWADFLEAGSAVSDATLDGRIAAQQPGDACYLSYTSGTTGQPKAVMYSHDNVLWSFHQLFAGINQEQAAGQKLGLSERTISYLPLSHIAGNIDLLGPIARGDDTNAEIYFAFPDALQGSIVQTLQEVRPTMMVAVPRVWEKFEAATRGMDGQVPKPQMLELLGLDQVKLAIVGAAPIAATTLHWFEELGLAINEIYGMTENTAFATMSYPTRRKVGAVGIPTLAPDTQDHQLCLYPGTNEICTRSRATMMGYMHNPEKTVDAIDAEGWLHTGDIGAIDDSGFISIVGRIKEMIISAGGENMAPVLIEEILKKELPALSNVMVVGDRQKYVIALMTLKLEPDPANPRGFGDKLAAEAAAVDPSATTVAEALSSKVWQAYLSEGVERANTQIISRAQNVRKFAVLSTDFSPSPALAERAELTPTLKLKRDVAHKNFAKDIKETYGADYIEMQIMGEPL